MTVMPVAAGCRGAQPEHQRQSRRLCLRPRGPAPGSRQSEAAAQASGCDSDMMIFYFPALFTCPLQKSRDFPPPRLEAFGCHGRFETCPGQPARQRPCGVRWASRRGAVSNFGRAFVDCSLAGPGAGLAGSRGPAAGSQACAPRPATPCDPGLVLVAQGGG